jgi:hypothetical protein
MSLIDRTNEEIHLSIHDDFIVVDTDFDSSLEPERRVTVYGLGETQDFHFNMTYEEAELLFDRLVRILGPRAARAVAAYGFETAIKSLEYEDGTSVEIVEMVNPFR